MKLEAVSAVSVMGVIIFSMIANVGAMPSYRKDSYSKENTYEKANIFDKYSSLTNAGNRGYSGNREHSGNRRQESYGGNSFQEEYIQYPPSGYSGYSGFGDYPKMAKDAPVPKYPMHIPDRFIAEKKNTDKGLVVTLEILAVAFLILLMQSGVLFENEDSLFGIFNRQRIVGSEIYAITFVSESFRYVGGESKASKEYIDYLNGHWSKQNIFILMVACRGNAVNLQKPHENA